MALQASGTSISFNQIRTEFGASAGKNLGAYRVAQSVGSLSILPLDTGIPQEGEIKFSNFYSKRLNVVVDYHTIADYTTREDARARYNAQAVTIIGGYLAPAALPADGSGKRIIVNVNRILGSAKGNRNYVALKSGSWGSNTNVDLVIGPSGVIVGAGGDGGIGANGTGTDGTQGTSGLGVQYPISLNNQGVIRAGRGGGGGGGGAYGTKYANTQKNRCSGAQNEGQVAGGGGGGGLGYPSGTGGGVQYGGSRINSNPQVGQNAGLNNNGGGGAGGETCGQGGCDQAGNGGSGAGAEGTGGTSPNKYNGGGGGAGSQGYAIIIDSSGSLISYVGNGPDGSQVSGSVV